MRGREGWDGMALGRAVFCREDVSDENVPPGIILVRHRFTLSLKISRKGLPRVGRKCARWRGGRGEEVRVGEVEEEESAVELPSRELGGPPSLDSGGHAEEKAWGLANLTGGGGAERRAAEEEVWGSMV